VQQKRWQILLPNLELKSNWKWYNCMIQLRDKILNNPFEGTSATLQMRIFLFRKDPVLSKMDIGLIKDAIAFIVSNCCLNSWCKKRVPLGGGESINIRKLTKKLGQIEWCHE
jgi:hypothetical protein